MSPKPSLARRADDVYRLPRALTRRGGMPVAPSAPAVPSAVRAFNQGAGDGERAADDHGAGDAEPGEDDAEVPPVPSDAGDVTPPPPAAVAPPHPPPPPPGSPQRRREPGAAALPGALRGRRFGLVLIGAVAALVVGLVLLLHASSTVTLTARQQTDPAIAAARDRAAAGDPQGAVRSLDQQAASASPEARTLLRDAEAVILGDAARNAASRQDALAALALLRQAAAFADTPQGHDAVAALPQALVDAARQLLRTPPADASAATLLREAVHDAPGSAAATLAVQLLAEPVPVTGQLTVAGKPAHGITAALFAVTADPPPPHPASATPVASAACRADGGFDLGIVPPGTYVFGYLDPAHQVHAGPPVTVAPAQLNALTESLPG